jgi:hypothetical protein
MTSENNTKNLQTEPVAYLVLSSSFRASPDGQDAEGHEWLEEAGCDTPGAFPVYRLPQTHPPDALDAARWRMLPAFYEEYQINGMKLMRDVDAALVAAQDAALAKHKEV